MPFGTTESRRNSPWTLIVSFFSTIILFLTICFKQFSNAISSNSSAQHEYRRSPYDLVWWILHVWSPLSRDSRVEQRRGRFKSSPLPRYRCGGTRLHGYPNGRGRVRLCFSSVLNSLKGYARNTLHFLQATRRLPGTNVY